MKKIETSKPIKIKDLPKDNFIEEEMVENTSAVERESNEKEIKKN